jgi:DNA repair ATPase RecN
LYRIRAALVLALAFDLAPCRSFVWNHQPSCRPRSDVHRSAERTFNLSTKQNLRCNKSVFKISALLGTLDGRHQQSYVSVIRSRNLAGAVSQREDGDIVIELGDSSHLVAVTGETGSGKSLLIARAIELLTGGKASSSLIVGGDPKNEVAPSSLQIGQDLASVEIELVLRGDYLKAAELALERISVDFSSELTQTDEDGVPYAIIVLGRDLVLASGNAKMRLKSICRINGQQVSMKALAAFSSPLLTVVDAATASAALVRPDARLSVVDTAVSDSFLSATEEAKREYSRARRKRERLEKELSESSLPRSFSRDNSNDLKMLDHWIDELDVFEKRLVHFCNNAKVQDKNTLLYETSRRLSSSYWTETAGSADSSSTMYEALVSFRAAVKALDKQLGAARNALDSLSALSSSQSAISAIERARNFLFDSVKDDSSSELLAAAAEQSHELLNDVESALADCSRFMEDDERGLLRTLERGRESCPTTLDDIEGFLLDWNTLARKHGVPPTTLPSCHRALKNERGGNVEVLALLSKAVADEELASIELKGVAASLTAERREIAMSLSASVTKRLPSLGMERSVFTVRVLPRDEVPSFSLGDDAVDFLIYNGERNGGGLGHVNEIASSGEKARILLAIECAIPGSVGASCAKGKQTDLSLWPGLPPIAVVYDEIDAHVGGRAAVAMSSMLVDQSRWSQVFAITHSPSVAAVADTHVVIQRLTSSNDGWRMKVDAVAVNGPERRKELARMASGDIATEEAEIFAEALIRDGSKAKDLRPNL